MNLDSSIENAILRARRRFWEAVAGEGGGATGRLELAKVNQPAGVLSEAADEEDDDEEDEARDEAYDEEWVERREERREVRPSSSEAVEDRSSEEERNPGSASQREKKRGREIGK